MYGRLSIRSGNVEQHVVKLEQVPRWIEQEPLSPSANHSESETFDRAFDDPLTSLAGSENGGTNIGRASKFALDHDVNAKLYLWRGTPWALEVDAVVNSSNENLDESHSSPGLHSAAGPELAEECATLGGCRTGLAKVTNGYDLPARRVIHTVGPRYAVRYHTAAENALSHCYRSCLELLVEQGLQSIAMGCIYTEAKGYPREPAAHVAIRTVRRFLEKHKDKITAVVFCTASATDTDIYKRLLPLYFPRNKYEEETAATKLPVDVGDENGETVISERKIRIAALPGTTAAPLMATPHTSGNISLTDHSPSMKRGESIDGLVDPAFMSMTRDPDQRRKEQWEKAAQAQAGWAWGRLVGLGGIGAPALSATEQNSLHGRFLARANAVNLTEVAEMKILYRGGVDVDGRPVMVIVGAHFLLRCLDLERFVLYVVKEFEPLISRPYSIVYFHSAASLQLQPDLGLVKRIHQILGRRHEHNLHAIYILHPSLGLKATVFALQLLVEPEVWKKVVYVERLLELFRYVPREQLTIPDFIFQHDLEVNGEKALGMDSRTRVIGNRNRLGSGTQ
jgi:O-acetyl-ADP-ribose deacetylase (regulator of RNase III)